MDIVVEGSATWGMETPPSAGTGTPPVVMPIGHRLRDMATDESRITENYAATIPANACDRLDVQPGDKLRWTATDEGELRVEIVRLREGALDDFEPEQMGGDEMTAHDLLGTERE